MKSAAHQYEDKLLEFAYGELPQHEADAVDAHVRGCTRCSQSLSEIRGVRATMAQLPMQSAPDAGLESLMAYAEQAAKRSSASTAPSLWKRFLMPLASMAALLTVGVIGFRANQEFDTSPASAVADTKLEEFSKARAEKADPPSAPADQYAQQQEVAVPPVVAAVSPETPAAEGGGRAGAKEGKNSALDGLNDLGKRGDVWAPEPKAAPQSVTRRQVKSPPVANDEQVRGNYSDVGVRGAKLAKDEPAPPPPPAQAAAEEKPSFGYGLGTSGGLNNAPTGSATGSTAPMAVKPSPAPAKEPLQEQRKEEETKLDAQKQRAKAQPEEVAAAPLPSSSAPSAPSKKPKGSISLKPLESRSSSSLEADDSEVPQKSDKLGVDRDSKFAERQRAESVTQSLESARVASNRGDRLSEIRLLAQVLQSGATGYERVEALKRICDAYEALGEPDRADPFCDLLLQEFPATAAARAVEDRRKRVQRAPSPAPKSAAPSREQKALDEAVSPKPAEQAPTSY